MTKPKLKPRLAFHGKTPVLTPNKMYCTLRVGGKWTKYYIEDRREVVLLDPRGKPFGDAWVEHCYFLPLHEVPVSWLLFNYDVAYHTHAGALAALREVYANCDQQDRRQDVDPCTMLSVVFFTMIEAPTND